MYGQNPYFPGMPQNPYMQPAQQPTIPRQEVVKVNGENGARAYQMGANSSALLLDESGELLWVVTTDGAGYKSVGAFDITPHQAAPVPDLSALEERITRLEGLINGINTANSENAEPQPAAGSSAPSGNRQAEKFDPFGQGRKRSYNGDPADGR